MSGREIPRTAALIVFAVCSVVLLCGGTCVPWIETEDAGGYWEKATLDPALEGAWYSPDPDDEEYYRFVRTKGGVYEIVQVDFDEEKQKVEKTILQARTLPVDGHKFLMVKPSPEELAREKEEAEKEGRPTEANKVGLWRYTVDGTGLWFYNLLDEALVKAGADARWKDVVTVDNEGKDPKIPKLNADAVRLLKWLAESADNWDRTEAALVRKPPEKPKTEVPPGKE